MWQKTDQVELDELVRLFNRIVRILPSVNLAEIREFVQKIEDEAANTMCSVENAGQPRGEQAAARKRLVVDALVSMSAEEIRQLAAEVEQELKAISRSSSTPHWRLA